MDTLTLKIPDALKEKLKSYSKKLGISKSDIVREALVEYLEKDEMKKQGTFYDLAKDIAGSVQNEPDLSTNKKHLDGYGE